MVDELREIRRYRHALNIAIAADVGMTLTNEDCKMLEYLLFGLLSEREANATLRRELTAALSDLAHSTYACPQKPKFMTYKGTSPGLVPSQKDIEAGLLRLEWSGPGEFHRFYGKSILDITEKWNEFCKSHEDE